jgi:hypothetical protein
MIYSDIVSLVISFINLIFSFSCLRRLRFLEVTQQIKAQQNETNVQNILNDRLLEIQNRKYALQRIKP